MSGLTEAESKKLSLVLSKDQVSQVERAAEARATNSDAYPWYSEALDDLLVRELGAERVCELLGHQ